MSSEVGSGHISIFPVMTGFKARVAKETQAAGAAGAKTFEGGFKGAGTKAGRTLGRDLKSALSAGAGDLSAAATKKFTAEVASASAALARVRLKQQDDAGRVRVAETRLAEAIAKSGAGSSQAVAAEERLATARRTLATTTDSVAAASARLKTAQKALADATKAPTGPGIVDRLKSGVSGAAGAISSGVASLASAARRAGSAVGDALGAGIKAGATTGVTAVAAGLGVALVSGFSRLTALDTARAKLTGLGSDAKTVAAVMRDANLAVTGTAFTLGDAATVAAGAMAAQIKPGQQLQGHLKNIANNAAAAGMSMAEMGSIFNKAATQANGVQNDVIGQLSDRGIPIYQELGKVLGVTAGDVFKLASEGKISFEMFSTAAAAAAGTVADEMGKTVPGALANLRSRLGRIGAGIFGGLDQETGQMFGLYARLGPLLGSINAALGPVETRAKAFGATLDRVLGPAMDWITNLLNRIGQGASLADVGLGKLAGVIGPVAGALAALGAGGLGGLLTRIPLLGGMLGGLAGPLAALGGPLGIVAAAFAGLALTGGDFSGLVQSLVGIIDQVVAALPKLIDAVVGAVPGIVDGILGAVPQLITAAIGIIQALVQGLVTAVPLLVDGAITLVNGLVDAIVSNLPMIIEAAIGLVLALIQGIAQSYALLITAAYELVFRILDAIVAALPTIIDGGVQLLMALVQGLIAALPVLLQASLSLVMGLLQAIIDNLPLIIDAGIQLLLSLVTGLINALPQLITAAITLVLQLFAGLIQMLPKLIEAGIQLVVALISGLVKAIPQIVRMLPQIVEAIWNGLAEVDWLSLGAQIIQGIIDGFFSMVGAVGDAIGSVLGGILDFFPHSPAKRGPLSAPGWRALKQSGAATMEQFIDGAQGAAPGFGESLAVAAAAASGRAQSAMTAVSASVGAAMSNRAAAVAASRAGAEPSRVQVLRVGDREFVGYLEELADGRVSDAQRKAAVKVTGGEVSA